MPIVHISLQRGRSSSYITALSNRLHQALVETFDVPQDDQFQIVHQFEPGDMIFDRHYLAGPRSDGWVLIEITAGRPRSIKKKNDFYRRLVELLESSPGIAPCDVMVVVTTTQLEDWSFGDGQITMLNK